MSKKATTDGIARSRVLAIKNQLGCSFFQPDHFFKVCPYSYEDLKGECRIRDLMHWRNLGIVWMMMCGRNMSEATALFNRNHSTAYNCIKNIENAIEGFDKELLKKIKSVEAKSNELGYMRKIPLNASMKQIISLRRKRIDPKLRIWNVVEKHKMRSTFMNDLSLLKKYSKYYPIELAENDCN